MNDRITFSEVMKAKMAAYKTETLGINENGKWRGREYKHILPSRLWTKNLWSGISETAVEHFRSNKIKWHNYRDNLLSSQILCVNVFFPLLNCPSLLDNFLRKFYPSLDKVTDIDFEYIGPKDKNYFNETGGRGYSRTSADVSITWEDTKGKNNLLLIEFKFTEQNFGGCGKSENPNPDRCYHGESVICSNKTQCYRSQVGRPYWDMILSPQGPFRVERLKKTGYCPFKYDFYQLMRNQLLAKCIAEDKSTGCSTVEFAVCSDARNKTLLTLSRPIDGNSNPLTVWQSFLKNKNKDSFKYFTIQQLLEHIDRENLPDELKSWRAYLDKRYGLKSNARSF